MVPPTRSRPESEGVLGGGGSGKAYLHTHSAMLLKIMQSNEAMKDALQQVDDGNGGIGMKDMEDELRVLEEQLDAQDDDELFCVACNKEMRNEKAFASHRKQKKHIENVERLREELLKDELINSDEFNSDDNISVNSLPGDSSADNYNETNIV